MGDGTLETLASGFSWEAANRKPQFAETRLQFHVAKISNFSKAFSSVQFSSFLFSQNIIQYKNTYRNCKFAREPRRNQMTYEPWAPQSQRNILKYINEIRGVIR